MTEKLRVGPPNKVDISRLSPQERLDLLEELGDSLSEHPVSVPLVTSLRDDLDRRLDEIEAGDDGGIPWEDVARRLRQHP